MALECHFRIFKVLYDEREASVAEEVGVTDEEEFRVEFDRLAELQILDGAGADEVAFGSDADRFGGFSGSVVDLAGVEDVDFRDFGFLVDLLFLELGILGLVESGGFFPGGLFEVEAFHQVREIQADGVALEQGQAGKADVIGVKVSGVFKSKQGSVDRRSTGDRGCIFFIYHLERLHRANDYACDNQA